LKDETSFWLSELRDCASILPLDLQGENTFDSVGTALSLFSVEETDILAREIPRLFQVGMREALLAALVESVARWVGRTKVLIDIESHGRDSLFDDIDIKRTVGCFTSIFPVALEWKSDAAPGRLFKDIQRMLNRIPNRGIGYGILRYLVSDQDTFTQLRSLPQSGILFNYIGQLDSMIADGGMFRLAEESPGPCRSNVGARPYVLDIQGMISMGQLRVSWNYSSNLHRRETIQVLADTFVASLRNLVSKVKGMTVRTAMNISAHDLAGIMEEVSA
jgi:non-ribosomal peptide synthase protein (TIGR01720 family)